MGHRNLSAIELRLSPRSIQRGSRELLGSPCCPSDALLATRNGRISLNMAAGGAFIARNEETLESGQYLNASYVGDQQDRRRRIFQELFASPRWKNFLETPHLLLWLDQWDSGFQFGEGLTRQGDSLLAVRLNLTRPAQGTELQIPSTLISFSTRRLPMELSRPGSGTMSGKSGRNDPVRVRPGFDFKFRESYFL